MTTLKSCKLLNAGIVSIFLLSSCSSDEPSLGVSEEKKQEDTSTRSSFNKAPEAPSLTEQDMEEFSVNKEEAGKLAEADDGIANSWYLDRLDEAGIKMDSSIAFVIRDRICEDIHRGGNLHTLSSDTLSSYHLTGKQQGVMIASSMLSSCPDEKLSVPTGAFDNADNLQP